MNMLPSLMLPQCWKAWNNMMRQLMAKIEKSDFVQLNQGVFSEAQEPPNFH